MRIEFRYFIQSIDKIRENGFELTKKRSRRYPTKTITDADYADDIARLANIPKQAETLLHSLERAVAGIGPHVNAHKTEYMCKKLKFDHTNKWYMQNPAPVLEDDTHKLLWDFNIPMDHLIPARRPTKKKKKLQNCRLCGSGGPQNRSEGI